MKSDYSWHGTCLQRKREEQSQSFSRGNASGRMMAKPIKIIKCLLNETLRVSPAKDSCFCRRVNAVCTTLKIFNWISGFPGKTSTLVNKINIVVKHQQPCFWGGMYIQRCHRPTSTSSTEKTPGSSLHVCETQSIPTLSLCSFLLTMTAVICWSMKMRIVTSSAGMAAARYTHHGFPPKGGINQPLSGLVGFEGQGKESLR